MTWSNWEKVSGAGLDFTDVLFEKKYHQELGGGIARIAVNRPQKYNAFTAHTQDELFHAFFDASHDPGIGVVIFTGVGDHFGTGGDVEWEAWGLREQFNWRYTPDRLMRICRKPIIAQVRGFCIGGSHHMAYLCDFTIAADTAIFGQNGPRVSSPADGYIIPYLARVVGAKKAREMWMLARRYSASEAYDMGLVNKVVPMPKLEEEVDKWCEELLSLSPGCIEVLKASFDDEIDHMPQLGLHSGWMYPDWFEMKECREGVDAFMQKRKPQFWKMRQAEAKARQDNPEPKA